MVVPTKISHAFGYPEKVSVKINTLGFFGSTAPICAPLTSIQEGTGVPRVCSVAIPSIKRSFLVMLSEDTCIRDKGHFAAFKSFLLKK